MEPKVKFKGFEGEWSKVKLCSISKKVTTRNMDMKYTTTLTNSAEHGIIDQLAFFDHQVSNNNNISGYYVVENGDFVYNPRISALAPVGPINQSQIGYTGVMSPLYYVFRVDGVDTDYLSYYFKTTLWHQYLKDVGNSGARFDRLAITDGDFQEMPISLPTNREEQHAIASYFRTLDAKLQASAKKVESLKKLKSASLVAMFPQNGESMPKVRFKGFEGEWIIKSFKELYKRSSIKNDLTYDSSKIISVANMYFKEDNMNTDEAYLLTYNVMKLGDIAFEGHKSKSFAHGRFVENSIGNGIVSHVFVVFSPLNEDYDINFWKYYINNEQVMGSKLVRCTKSSTMMTDLVVDDFLKETILVPSLEEQQEVGRYFATLDRKIALETARLEKLKQIKLACLDKMFV